MQNFNKTKKKRKFGEITGEASKSDLHKYLFKDCLDFCDPNFGKIKYIRLKKFKITKDGLPPAGYESPKPKKEKRRDSVESSSSWWSEEQQEGQAENSVEQEKEPE